MDDRLLFRHLLDLLGREFFVSHFLRKRFRRKQALGKTRKISGPTRFFSFDLLSVFFLIQIPAVGIVPILKFSLFYFEKVSFFPSARNKYSLLLCRVTGLLPFLPAAFESIDLRISHVHQLLCHTGTGAFTGSGTVEDKGLILRILVAQDSIASGSSRTAPLIFKSLSVQSAPRRTSTTMKLGCRASP